MESHPPPMGAPSPLEGRRLRALFWLTEKLIQLGLYPSARKLCATPVAKRRAIKPAPWMTYPVPATVRTEYSTIPGRSGQMPVKVFIPAETDPKRPAILFLHGGGWIAGGYDSLDYLCANACAELQARVLALEYRLAPEHRYPAALDDCRDALGWMAEHHASLGSSHEKVIVMGDSAGGNLAAALALAVRGSTLVIAAQVLVYPPLDATLCSPSIDFHGAGLSRKDLLEIQEAYVGRSDPADPLVSPLLAEDLSGLPPALILTGDCDMLRDDGARYAERLRQAGVDVTYCNYRGMPHGFFSMPKLCGRAPEALGEVIRFLKGRPSHA